MTKSSLNDVIRSVTFCGYNDVLCWNSSPYTFMVNAWTCWNDVIRSRNRLKTGKPPLLKWRSLISLTSWGLNDVIWSQWRHQVSMTSPNLNEFYLVCIWWQTHYQKLVRTNPNSPDLIDTNQIQTYQLRLIQTNLKNIHSTCVEAVYIRIRLDFGSKVFWRICFVNIDSKLC